MARFVLANARTIALHRMEGTLATGMSSGGARAALRVFAAVLLGACGDGAAEPGRDAVDDTAADAAELGDASELEAPGETCDADRLQWGLGGGLMLPGTDCLDCHRVGGSADDSVYTIAGTVLASATCPQGVEGAEVYVVDDAGTEVMLLTNAVGNFYTDEALVPPFRTRVVLGGVETPMFTPFRNGSCAACHYEGSRLGFVYGDR
jgi:hypothetical protein